MKNKKNAEEKNSYENLCWVEDGLMEKDLKKYNKFISEEEEMNGIIINNIKRLEEKETIISKLSHRIDLYENLSSFDDQFDDFKESKKPIQKSKSVNIKNTSNNKNELFSSKNKYNFFNDFDQNLNENIKDFSKNQYFYLEGNGLGLLNNNS